MNSLYSRQQKVYEQMQADAEKEIQEKKIMLEHSPSKAQLLNMKNEGDFSHYTKENLMKRKRLMKDPEVVSAVNEFWKIIDLIKDEGNLNKESYVLLNLKMHLALIPDVDRVEAEERAGEDWDKDTNGTGVLDYEQFFSSMFEVADIWVESIDGIEYAAFLRRLYHTIVEPDIDGENGLGAEPRFRSDDDIVCQTDMPEEEVWDFDEEADTATDSSSLSGLPASASAGVSEDADKKTKELALKIGRSFRFNSQRGWGSFRLDEGVGRKVMVPTRSDGDLKWHIGVIKAVNAMKKGGESTVCVEFPGGLLSPGGKQHSTDFSASSIKIISSPNKRRNSNHSSSLDGKAKYWEGRREGRGAGGGDVSGYGDAGDGSGGAQRDGDGHLHHGPNVGVGAGDGLGGAGGNGEIGVGAGKLWKGGVGDNGVRGGNNLGGGADENGRGGGTGAGFRAGGMAAMASVGSVGEGGVGGNDGSRNDNAGGWKSSGDGGDNISGGNSLGGANSVQGQRGSGAFLGGKSNGPESNGGLNGDLNPGGQHGAALGDRGGAFHAGSSNGRGREQGELYNALGGAEDGVEEAQVREGEWRPAGNTESRSGKGEWEANNGLLGGVDVAGGKGSGRNGGVWRNTSNHFEAETIEYTGGGYDDREGKVRGAGGQWIGTTAGNASGAIDRMDGQQQLSPNRKHSLKPTGDAVQWSVGGTSPTAADETGGLTAAEPYCDPSKGGRGGGGRFRGGRGDKAVEDEYSGYVEGNGSDDGEFRRGRGGGREQGGGGKGWKPQKHADGDAGGNEYIHEPYREEPIGREKSGRFQGGQGGGLRPSIGTSTIRQGGWDSPKHRPQKQFTFDDDGGGTRAAATATAAAAAAAAAAADAEAAESSPPKRPPVQTRFFGGDARQKRKEVQGRMRSKLNAVSSFASTKRNRTGVASLLAGSSSAPTALPSIGTGNMQRKSEAEGSSDQTQKQNQRKRPSMVQGKKREKSRRASLKHSNLSNGLPSLNTGPGLILGGGGAGSTFTAGATMQVGALSPMSGGMSASGAMRVSGGNRKTFADPVQEKRLAAIKRKEQRRAGSK
jgi:hypothetical protein